MEWWNQQFAQHRDLGQFIAENMHGKGKGSLLFVPRLQHSRSTNQFASRHHRPKYGSYCGHGRVEIQHLSSDALAHRIFGMEKVSVQLCQRKRHRALTVNLFSFSVWVLNWTDDTRHMSSSTILSTHPQCLSITGSFSTYYIVSPLHYTRSLGKLVVAMTYHPSGGILSSARMTRQLKI